MVKQIYSKGSKSTAYKARRKVKRGNQRENFIHWWHEGLRLASSSISQLLGFELWSVTSGRGLTDSRLQTPESFLAASFLVAPLPSSGPE